MRNYKKKNWTDSVIEAANRAQTPKEQALREILRGIFVIKDNPDLHPIYTGDEKTDAILAHRAWAIQKIMHNTIRDLQESYEPPELIWDCSTDKDKPRLKVIPDPPKQMFSNLVQNLQNPEWVSALRICPECHNFILSNAKWLNKFCSTKCREKHHGRKKKKNEKKKRELIEIIEQEMESKIVKCPNNSDTPDRIRINKKRFEVIMRCPKCTHMILGGKFDNYLKHYSGSGKCPNCDTPRLRYFLTTSDREEYEYTVSAWEELVKTYKSKA